MRVFTHGVWATLRMAPERGVWHSVASRMTYVVAILLFVLAVSSSVLLVGLANLRRSAPRPNSAPVAASPAAVPAPPRRTPLRALPRPPPLSEDSLSLREIDRSFSAPSRFRFESRAGEHGRG